MRGRAFLDRLAALVLCLAALVVPAIAAETTAGPAERPAVRLWVTVETAGPAIRPQEMVILRVHGRYHVPVTLEKLEDPTGPGFRLVRIGRDVWHDVFEDGLTVRALSRTVAVFPERSGETVIPPFVHHLTVLNTKMKTEKIDVPTAPTVLTVAPAEGPADAWWLPARAVRVTETWSVPPEALAIGQSTRRTIAIEADGVFDDQLPPAPSMRADGLIVFPGVTERKTRIGLGQAKAEADLALRERSLRRPGRFEEVKNAPEGPIARVVYTWDIRPASDRSIVLPAVEIPWFDVAAGVMRTETLPPRTVALQGMERTADVVALETKLGIMAPVEGRPVTRDGALAVAATVAAALAATAAGGLAGLALFAPGALPAARASAERARQRRRAAAGLRGAARRGDAAGLSTAIGQLVADGAVDEDALTGLKALDRHLYAEPPGPAPDLPAIARETIARLKISGPAR